MTINTSRVAYTDCFGLLDKAIADSKGIRVKFASMEDARLFRLRLHNARKIDRKDNITAYGEDHPMAGRSIYDALVVRIKRDTTCWWLRIEKLAARQFEVESLTEEEPPKEVPAPGRIELSPILQLKRRV